MHYLTEVDLLLFSYPSFEPGERIDWRGFWEGRVSSKRSLHMRHGLHDQRLEYSIDVELAWRLREQGLEVIYHPAARSVHVAADGLRGVLPALRGQGARAGRRSRRSTTTRRSASTRGSRAPPRAGRRRGPSCHG